MTDKRFDLKLNTKVISFDHEIGNIIDLEDKVLVMVWGGDNILNPRYNFKSSQEQNIFLFRKNGELIWRIESVPSIFKGEPAHGFTGIFQDQDQICAYHPSSYTYLINMENGKIKLIDKD